MTIPAGVGCFWPKTVASIPSGWTRETSLDSRYVKMIPNTITDPGTTGGSDTHGHTSTAHGHTFTSHTHTWPVTANGQSFSVSNGTDFTGVGSGDAVSHNHNVSGTSSTTASASDGPNWDTHTELPPYLSVIYIKSDGTAAGFPNNAIVYANAAPPVGWAIANGTGTDNAVNKMMRGAGAGADGGGNAGTGDSHTHTQIHTHAHATHGHTLSFTAIAYGEGAQSQLTSGPGNTLAHAHNHGSTVASGNTVPSGTSSATDTSTAGNNVPSWQKILPIQNTSGVQSARRGLIGWWLGTLASIPGSFQLCDGTNGTPNLSQSVHVMGAASTGEISTTGGATTHTHSGAGHVHASGDGGHTHAQATSTNSDVANCPNSGNISSVTSHTHGAGSASSSVSVPSNSSSTTPDTSSATNAPTYTTVAFVQMMVDDGGWLMVSD